MIVSSFKNNLVGTIGFLIILLFVLISICELKFHIELYDSSLTLVAFMVATIIGVPCSLFGLAKRPDILPKIALVFYCIVPGLYVMQAFFYQ